MPALRDFWIALWIAGVSVSGYADAPKLDATSQSSGEFRLSWINAAPGYVLEEASSVSAPDWAVVPVVPPDTGLAVINRPVTGTTRFFRLRDLPGVPPARLSATSPAEGETGVSVNREVVFDFSLPLAPGTTITTANFFAGFSGRKFLSRVELSSDRRKASLFFLEPVPGATRINVSFTPSGVKDLFGRPVDGDDDGQPGGARVLRYDTAGNTPVAGTAVIGRVLASARSPGPNPQDVPLAGVTITVDGSEQTMRTTTDETGSFKLNNAPSGRFFVHVDGRTSPLSQWPGGAYYPFVGKAWEATAGREDNPAGGTGVIYLPLIAADTLQTASAVAETTVLFPAAVLAANPALAGVQVVVPANSLFGDNGQRGGKVGIAPVPPDRLPEPLPPGLRMPLVITIQTDGASNFDRPVPVRFPNLADPTTGEKLPPGAKSALWSFSHDTGSWEVVGPMTVTPDGEFVETDPGVGVRQPGWHGTNPATGAGGGPLGGGSGGCFAGGGGEEGARRFPRPAGGGQNCVQNPDFKPDDPANYNGCGPDGWDYLVPDNPNGPFSPCATFYDACKKHDIGYNTCGRPQAVTDSQFCAELVIACNCLDGDAYFECINNANFYCAVVTGGGQDAYDDAQGKACKCDPPPPPPGSEPCDAGPGSPVGGGGGSGGGGGGGDGGPEAIRLKLRPIPAGPTPHAIPLPDDLIAQSGPHRFAVIDLNTLQVVQRGRAGAGGIAFPQQLILAPNTPYDIAILQEATLREGKITIRSGPPGSRLELPVIKLGPPVTFDSDFDGLHDGGELIMGTNARSPDTDGDGINDAAEVRQGLNPLGAQPGITGIIAAQDTPGEAQDIVALNQFAFVADGAAGVAVFSVADSANPVHLSQLVTPGAARRVAWGGGFLAVACEGNELLSVALTDPVIPVIHRRIQLGAEARAVAVAGNLAYVGLSSGEVAVVNLADGEVLGRQPLGDVIHDVALDSDSLFVLTAASLLTSRLVDDGLGVLDSKPCSFFAEGLTTSRRLFVGGGRAYATGYPGFDVFDVSNPAALSRLGSAVDAGANSFKQIVANGSGIGLATVGINPRADGTHDAWLYDLSDPANTTHFITQFVTPGTARAVTIFNGLGYVADGEAGLQVINYLAPDTQKVPPTITLRTPFEEGKAEEGQLATVTADVTDDVQVRNVEFLIDGVRVLTDGNFPFQMSFITPVRNAGRTSFTLQARATDTGGNSTLTSILTLVLTSDAHRPRVVRVTPGNGVLVGSIDTVQAFIDEAIDPSTLAGGVRLVALGEDRVVDTADDTLVTGLIVTYQSELKSLVVRTPAPLSPGSYQLQLVPPIADWAGNTIVPFATVFRVFAWTDLDRDGVPDELEPSLGLNPLTSDTNVNGVPDGLEDFDNDGVSNTFEILLGLDPKSASTFPPIPDKLLDRDGDLLTDEREAQAGSDWLKPDTDGDLFTDEAEVTVGTDPANRRSYPLGVRLAPPAGILNRRLAGLGGVVAGVISPPATEAFSPGYGGAFLALPPVEVFAPGRVPNTPSHFFFGEPPVEVLFEPLN